MIYDLAEEEAKRKECRMVPMVKLATPFGEQIQAPACAGSGCVHWLETVGGIEARGFCAVDAARGLLFAQSRTNGAQP